MVGLVPQQHSRPRAAAARKRRLAAAAAAAVCLCGAALACVQEPTGTLELTVGGAVFRVEQAVTPEQRERGLMFREHLGEREGMLFVFEEERMLSFWMRNTPLPLSIAFIDARGVIVHMADLVPHSERPVSSRVPARFALEVNRGAFERAGVAVGDLVILPPALR